jgi:Anti-sigma-28 factor, FlgM
MEKNHITTDSACPFDAQKVADVRLQIKRGVYHVNATRVAERLSIETAFLLSGERKMNGAVFFVGIAIVVCAVFFHKPTEAHHYEADQDDVAIEYTYPATPEAKKQRKELKAKREAYFRENVAN